MSLHSGVEEDEDDLHLQSSEEDLHLEQALVDDDSGAHLLHFVPGAFLLQPQPIFCHGRKNHLAFSVTLLGHCLADTKILRLNKIDCDHSTHMYFRTNQQYLLVTVPHYQELYKHMTHRRF